MYNIVDVPADGACLWHCLAYADDGDDGDGDLGPFKAKIGDYIVRNADRPMNRSSVTYRSAIATELDLDARSAPIAYARALQQPRAWGGAVDISAYVDMRRRPVRVYARAAAPARLRMVQDFRPRGRPDGGTVRLLYDKHHYCLLEKCGPGGPVRSVRADVDKS